jgi:hypothetical protein
MTAFDVMMQGTARTQRHEDHVALGRFGCLADGFRHFARLAVTEADAALLVADDDERGKTEATAALDHFRDAIDVNELVDELARQPLRVGHGPRPRPPRSCCAIS